ncbi:SMI1/KNR4 family protein [Vibrio sp. MACH09]|uniref:SMI1/KNR4 family protein n=1 Tax=Vibrio sp. MACH09 TaxID=3025122 RepID=UPI00279302F2|nr:SMI1/KNR4 family protein [Vibrio sp. MACH09]GLO62930.1 SMI1/KNR4 family protein [Vibrio sp. MACH09]
MWKSLVENLGKGCRFESGASETEVSKAEVKLNIGLPQDLKECLYESNGIYGEYELGLVWSVERLVSTNIEFRSNSDFVELYMPFDSVLFFADAGNGDQFFFPMQGGEIRREDVFVWNHEEDSRAWVAPSLKRYVEWMITGKINV